MKIQKITTGALQVNTYLLTDESTGKIAVIDPGAPDRLLLDAIRPCKDLVTMILLTHGHFDHIGGVKNVSELTGAPVYALEEELQLLTDERKNLSFYFDDPITIHHANPLHDGDTILLGNTKIHVLHTPGHSPGSVCFLTKDALFSGDTLFAGSVGRTDFVGGDPVMLMQSVSNLANLSGDYRVFPGHGEATTLEYERKHNPYCGKELRF